MGRAKVCTTEVTPDCYPCGYAIKPWYNEVNDYDFATAAAKQKGLAVLHFTQVRN